MDLNSGPLDYETSPSLRSSVLLNISSVVFVVLVSPLLENFQERWLLTPELFSSTFQGKEENWTKAGPTDSDVGADPAAGAGVAETGRSLEAGIGGEEGRGVVAADAFADDVDIAADADDVDVGADDRFVVVADRREAAAEANVADGF